MSVSGFLRWSCRVSPDLGGAWSARDRGQWLLAVLGWPGGGPGGRVRGGSPAALGEKVGFAALEQLQPDLAAGRERGNGLPQQLDWRFADDRDGGRVQPVGDLGAGEGGADDHAAPLIHDDPCGPRCAVPVERGAGGARAWR